MFQYDNFSSYIPFSLTSSLFVSRLQCSIFGDGRGRCSKNFGVWTHLRVRDMCQYQIKTMSIDWKIIIVAVLCIENIKSAMPHRAKSAYSFASNGQNMVNAAIKHGRCINNATVGYFHTESEEERGKERERESDTI